MQAYNPQGMPLPPTNTTRWTTLREDDDEGDPLFTVDFSVYHALISERNHRSNAVKQMRIEEFQIGKHKPRNLP